MRPLEKYVTRQITIETGAHYHKSFKMVMVKVKETTNNYSLKLSLRMTCNLRIVSGLKDNRALRYTKLHQNYKGDKPRRRN